MPDPSPPPPEGERSGLTRFVIFAAVLASLFLGPMVGFAIYVRSLRPGSIVPITAFSPRERVVTVEFGPSGWESTLLNRDGRPVRVTGLHLPSGEATVLRFISGESDRTFDLLEFGERVVIPAEDSREPGVTLRRIHVDEVGGSEPLTFDAIGYDGGTGSVGGHDAAVVLYPPGQFETWIADGSVEWLTSLETMRQQLPPAEQGRVLVQSRGCLACHPTDQAKKVAPSWNGLIGSTVEITVGEPVVADDEYLRESILRPDAKIVTDYKNLMPSYAGQLEDWELDAVLAYLKSLGDGAESRPVKADSGDDR